MHSSEIHSWPSITNQLNGHLETQLALCDALERIADSLPDNVDPMECLQVASQIYPTIKSAHTFEEKELFPLIKNGIGPGEVNDTLQQLYSDHWEDESYAYELRDALMGLVKEPKTTNIEALGYMLRGFFGNLRRHIAFERNYFSTEILRSQKPKGNA